MQTVVMAETREEVAWQSLTANALWDSLEFATDQGAAIGAYASWILFGGTISRSSGAIASEFMNVVRTVQEVKGHTPKP